MPRRKSSPGGKPVFGGNWEMGKKLGSGAFGEIYQGTDLTTGDIVAIKLESREAKPAQLKAEAKLLLAVAGPGIPKVYWHGVDNGYNCLVMTLLGPSIDDLFSFCERRFSLKTVLLLADQMISLLEVVHEKGILHRDVKPENFLMGVGNRGNRLYLIDFGLSKRYLDAEGTHIPMKEGKRLTGTARYVSVSTHLGVEQGRRDDMECLAYCLIQLMRGRLPWQGFKAATAMSKYKKIEELKIALTVDQLCEDMPEEFATFLSYTRSLRFHEKPDYEYCRSLFRSLLFTNGDEYDYVFDWSVDDPEACKQWEENNTRANLRNALDSVAE